MKEVSGAYIYLNSPDLTKVIQNIQILPFSNVIQSDHIAVIMDINVKTLLGNIPDDITRHPKPEH